MARTKQTYRKPVLPKLVKFIFFQASKKVDESLWVPPNEDSFSAPMLDKMKEWSRGGDDDGTQQIRDAMTKAGFPLDLSRGKYEYGQPNKRRKAREPLFKWHSLGPAHSIKALLHDWRDGTIYLRCKSVCSDKKRARGMGDVSGICVDEGGPEKKVKLDMNFKERTHPPITFTFYVDDDDLPNDD